MRSMLQSGGRWLWPWERRRYRRVAAETDALTGRGVEALVGAPYRTITGGLRIETRPVPTLGLVLPHEGGEVFVRWETIEELSEITAEDLAFGVAYGPLYVAPDASRALVAAGLARHSTRGSLYGTDALRALVREA